MAARGQGSGPPRGRHRQVAQDSAGTQAAKVPPQAPAAPTRVARASPVAGAGVTGTQDLLPPGRRRVQVNGPVRRPDATGKFGSRGERDIGWLDRVLGARGWPLAAILALQAALSLRLIWSTTAFIDEGEYLTIGHLELAHLLHHAAMPEVASYLSGSPVFYPPLAAIADNLGGLAGARLLSLAFMLLATFALYGVARRLFSRTAAFFACALFATLGPTQFLGAFATYDAMALALLALAAWLGVRATAASPALRYTLISTGGAALAVADATKYASALFNPVIIAVVALANWRVHGRRAGLDAAAAMTLAGGVLLAVGYDLAGSNYALGLSSTTLARAEGGVSVGSVLALAERATGIIAVLAVLGALMCTLRRRAWVIVALAWTLAIAVFLAPAEQARIHTLVSLFKHVDYGAWFACAIAGYLIAELPAMAMAVSRLVLRAGTGRPGRPGPAILPSMALALGTVAVLVTGVIGVKVADGQYGTWPDAKAMIAAFGQMARPGQHYLAEDPSVITYYLRSEIPFEHVDTTYYFSYTDPRTGQVLVNGPAYADAIKDGYFAAIVISWDNTLNVDEIVARDISTYKDYRLARMIPYQTAYGRSDFDIWIRVPARSR